MVSLNILLGRDTQVFMGYNHVHQDCHYCGVWLFGEWLTKIMGCVLLTLPQPWVLKDLLHCGLLSELLGQ